MDIVAPSGKTISVNELALSRSGSTLNGGGESRGFWLTGSNSEVDIEYALENAPNIPRSTQRGYIYNGASWQEPEVEKGDQSIWKATVDYVSPGGFRQGQVQVRVGTARLRVTASTENQKVVVPYELRGRVVAGGNWLKMVPYEGIGDNGKTFEGIDVPRPVFGFAYDFNVPALQATSEFFTRCDNAVGKTNSAEFKGYPIGEVLCTRIEGVYSTNEDTTLTFEFKRKANRGTDVLPKYITASQQPKPDETVTVPPTRAWDIWDIHTSTTIGTNPQKIRVKINQVDVYRVFEEYDFNLLGIPGPDIRTQTITPAV